MDVIEQFLVRISTQPFSAEQLRECQVLVRDKDTLQRLRCDPRFDRWLRINVKEIVAWRDSIDGDPTDAA